MRVAFLIHELGAGGAERVMVHLANGLVGRGHEVSIHTLSTKSINSFYPLDSRIEHHRLGLNVLPTRKGLFWTLQHILRLVLNLRRHLRAQAPEVLVAFIDTTNIFAILASFGLRIPVIISERSDPRSAPLRSIWKVVRQITYPFSSSLVVQSNEVKDWFPLWIRRKTKVIPNPVLSPPKIKQDSSSADAAHTILAVGRLGPEKGFDVLLQAFAEVAPQFQDWNLDIWGEGPDRPSLETQRADLHLEDRVRLPGTTQDIHSRYANAQLFALSSRFEGFPNALCEAMSHGLPVVATSCSGGVRDIVRPNVDGLLVAPGDSGALAMALGTLMGTPDLRASLGRAAKQVTLRFNFEQILDDWEKVLDQAARGSLLIRRQLHKKGKCE